jgi:ribose 5-phosphate isomerase A
MKSPTPPTADELKRQAAIAALDEIRDGMIVGLGTGSTASHFIRELGVRVKGGLRVLGIPTSEASRMLAGEVGVSLTTLKNHPEIDVTVDGADEVSPELDLIKGLGGALVREKIVAHASKRVIIVVDDSKMVDKLGKRAPIPVEVVPFAVDSVMLQLVRWNGSVKIREREGRPFVSDNGNLIVDWQFGVIDQPPAVEMKLKSITGVVDSGIFAKVAAKVIVAGKSLSVRERG